jgi:hypothetical protein
MALAPMGMTLDIVHLTKKNMSRLKTIIAISLFILGYSDDLPCGAGGKWTYEPKNQCPRNSVLVHPCAEQKM